MLILKKIWSLVRVYWYYPVLLALVVALFWSNFKRSEVQDIFDNMVEQHAKELSIINKANSELEARNAATEKKYEVLVVNLKKDYEKQVEDLKAEQKEMVKDIVEQFGDSPEDMAEIIAREFNFEVIR